MAPSYAVGQPAASEFPAPMGVRIPLGGDPAQQTVPGPAAVARSRSRTAADPSRCTVPWGVCPEHGGTLKSSGGRAWCTDFGCLNAWSYDRLDAVCTEPATHTVQADNGDRYVVCDGHAVTARVQITDGQVLPGLPARFPPSPSGLRR